MDDGDFLKKLEVGLTGKQGLWETRGGNPFTDKKEMSDELEFKCAVQRLGSAEDFSEAVTVLACRNINATVGDNFRILKIEPDKTETSIEIPRIASNADIFIFLRELVLEILKIRGPHAKDIFFDKLHGNGQYITDNLERLTHETETFFDSYIEEQLEDGKQN